MNTLEGRKIALIMFHIIALLFLFISVSLILDQIFSQSLNEMDSQNYIEITIEYVFAIISIVIGFISWLMILMKWIKNGKIEFYLKTMFLSKSLIIPGLVLLLII